MVEKLEGLNLASLPVYLVRISRYYTAVNKQHCAIYFFFQFEFFDAV
jgi:hypothetical protein